MKSLEGKFTWLGKMVQYDLQYLHGQVFRYDKSKRLYLLRDVLEPISEVENEGVKEY